MQMTILPNLNKTFKKTWVLHTVFWIALVILFALLRTLRSEDIVLSWKTLLFEFIPFSGVANAVYLNLNLLVPRFLNKKRYLLYIFLLLSLVVANALFVFFLLKAAEPVFIGMRNGPHPNSVLFFSAYSFMQLIFISMTSFFHFVRENNRLTEIALTVTEIESNRLKAELNSLKAQINPHFLFNTLNNIYSYSLFKSEKTPDMILKLSGLMNYIIYECQADQVELGKEIDFIHNYMELEKMRVEDTLTIDIQIDGDPTGHKIAPLLFVPFLENAFKHGAAVQEQQPYIRLKLLTNESGLIHFECENTNDEGPDEIHERSGGIGLENVRKRLELLYPGDYELNIDQDSKRFLVTLNLQLKGD